MVLLASGMQCKVLAGFQFSAGGLVRLPKFEVKMNRDDSNRKPVLAPEDVRIATMYGRLYCLQTDRAARQLRMYRFYRDAVVPQPALPLYSPEVGIDRAFLHKGSCLIIIRRVRTRHVFSLARYSVWFLVPRALKMEAKTEAGCWEVTNFPQYLRCRCLSPSLLLVCWIKFPAADPFATPLTSRALAMIRNIEVVLKDLKARPVLRSAPHLSSLRRWILNLRRTVYEDLGSVPACGLTF
jgi:hypothetical protein